MTLKGYYLKTWDCNGSLLPQGTNTVVYFSGWSNVNNVIEESNTCKVQAALGHQSYISFGGGNTNGHISASNLNGFTEAINAGRLSGYNGIVLDVEEGHFCCKEQRFGCYSHHQSLCTIWCV